VVFDEGHSLRNPKAAMTKIAAGLSADRRWVVTGTPIGGEATDLEGQFMALQLAPFDTPGFFRSRVKKPFHKYQAQSVWGQTG
jgi:SWI/SNF-related matrix-associated actin-dependent regulator of chromatin subfamily A3